jgi:hypothetical protein
MGIPKVRGLGLVNNGPFWARYARDVWIAEIEILHETIFRRALPAFASIDEEAEKVSTDVWNGLAKGYHPEGDLGDLAEAAHEAGIDHYLMRVSVSYSRVVATGSST